MMFPRLRVGLVSIICLLAWFTSTATAQNRASTNTPQLFQFKDVGREAGLFPALSAMHGHGTGWGDVDGNGWPDLYVGTFHTDGPPNQLLLNDGGKFRLSNQKSVEISSRATGIVFADLDNDGDLDLYVASMPVHADSRLAQRLGRPLAGCSLFRNDGGGRFTNFSGSNGACPTAFGGRSVALVDFDGDGLLDLLVGEEPITGYNGSETHSSRLFKNLGGLQFKDVSREVGLPEGIPGLGVAAADVNNDGWPDFFLASPGDGNRLFLNDGAGRFREAPGSRETFLWPTAGGDDMVCGVTLGDVNRDGLLDLLLGHHYSRPWLEPVANRLYLNRGLKDGVPRFEDVTEKVGLVPLPMKAPHVEIQDFDNDGWPDIYANLVKFAGGQSYPLIFKHGGLRGGLPTFSETTLGVNDFPNDTDRAVTRSGAFFEKMIADGKIIYSAPGPAADFNRDGRLDVFLANWWSESPSMLLENQTPSGNWLQVRVEGSADVNRMGIGSRVNVYPPGKLGDAKSLLCSREIAVGFGYASGQEAMAHFGLGDLQRCDLRVVLPHGKGTIDRRDVEVNQQIVVDRSAIKAS